MKTIKITPTTSAKGIARKLRRAWRGPDAEAVVIVYASPGGTVAYLVNAVPPAVTVTC